MIVRLSSTARRRRRRRPQPPHYAPEPPPTPPPLPQSEGNEETVEKVLFRALETTKLVDGITTGENYSRCGRTDKGVSALGNVSGRPPRAAGVDWSTASGGAPASRPAPTGLVAARPALLGGVCTVRGLWASAVPEVAPVFIAVSGVVSTRGRGARRALTPGPLDLIGRAGSIPPAPLQDLVATHQTTTSARFFTEDVVGSTARGSRSSRVHPRPSSRKRLPPPSDRPR